MERNLAVLISHLIIPTLLINRIPDDIFAVDPDCIREFMEKAASEDEQVNLARLLTKAASYRGKGDVSQSVELRRLEVKSSSTSSLSDYN